MTATVTRLDHSQRSVLNLGWLLRHWKDVERFEVRPASSSHLMIGDERVNVNPSPMNGPCDALLVAWLKGGGCYATSFASCDVLRSWLDRPVFRGVTIHWFGVEVEGKRFYKYENRCGE